MLRKRGYECSAIDTMFMSIPLLWLTKWHRTGGQKNVRVGRWEEYRDRLASGYDMTVTYIDLWQLWWPTQDLHKIKNIQKFYNGVGRVFLYTIPSWGINGNWWLLRQGEPLFFVMEVAVGRFPIRWFPAPHMHRDSTNWTYCLIIIIKRRDFVKKSGKYVVVGNWEEKAGNESEKDRLYILWGLKNLSHPISSRSWLWGMWSLHLCNL